MPVGRVFESHLQFEMTWDQSRPSLGFYHFHLVTLIQPFSGTHPNSFSLLARILPFPGIRWDFTIFRYSLGFYNFHLVTLIQPFSDTRPDSVSVLARILPYLTITILLPE